MGQDIRVKEEGIAQEQDEGCSEGPRKAVQRPEPAWRRAQLGLGLRGWADAGCLGKMGVPGFLVFLELRRDSRVTTGNSGFLLCWPREVQSSIRVSRKSWGLLLSHCRAKETPSRLVSRT